MHARNAAASGLIALLLAAGAAHAADLSKLARNYPGADEQMQALHGCLYQQIAYQWAQPAADAEALADGALQACDPVVVELASRSKKARSSTYDDLVKAYRKALVQDIEQLRKSNPGYAQCTEKGGRWFTPPEAVASPLKLATQCDTLTTDAGKPCLSQGSCEGACEVNFHSCAVRPQGRPGPEIFNSDQRCYAAHCSAHRFDRPAVILDAQGQLASPYAQ